MPNTSPLFSPLGRTDDRCPYCLVAFVKRPKRKIKCLACEDYVHVRTRPLDQEKVLLTEMDAAALEEEWKIHFEWTSKISRSTSLEWQTRIDDAQAAGPHSIAEVELLSQRAMEHIIDDCAAGMAPREATEKAIKQITNSLVRKEVEQRINQLKVQFIFGTKKLTE